MAQIAYSVLYLGVIGAGAIFTAVNPAYSVAELSHHMDMVTAKFLFVEPPILQKTLKAAKSCRIATPNVLAFDVHEDLVYDGVKSWTNLLQYGESNFEVCSHPDTTVATYKTSSGTSGLPKVVRISHSYLMTQAKLRMNEEGIDYEVRFLRGTLHTMSV
jgi:acyl-CoA synthetase (AMP-forming)/AMP-acid ligase II